MATLAAAVCPFAGGVSSRAATERASGKKRSRVAPARDSPSACPTKTTRNSIVTAAAAEMSSKQVLQKRLASEFDALLGFLKKAELISRRGACKGGAPPTAGKKQERFLASKSNQRAKPIEEDFNAPSVKKRKISTLVVVEHKQKPRMSPRERNQIAGRLSKFCGELTPPRHIVEFLEKQFGDADGHGQIEINLDSVQDSVLFELKNRLDMFAEESKDEKVGEESKDENVAEERKDNNVAEERKADKVAEESKAEKVAEESKGEKAAEERKGEKAAEDNKGEVVREKKEEEYADISGGLPGTIETGSKPSSSSSGDSDQTKVLQQSSEAKKVHDVQQRATPKAVDMRRLLYRANLRRQLLEMEKAVLPDQRIDPSDLQRLGIKEYGHPSLMLQLGFVVKVDA